MLRTSKVLMILQQWKKSYFEHFIYLKHSRTSVTEVRVLVLRMPTLFDDQLLELLKWKSNNLKYTKKGIKILQTEV